MDELGLEPGQSCHTVHSLNLKKVGCVRDCRRVVKWGGDENFDLLARVSRENNSLWEYKPKEENGQIFGANSET